MGFYIETEVVTGKAQWLIDNADAEITFPIWPPVKGKVLVCVVENADSNSASCDTGVLPLHQIPLNFCGGSTGIRTQITQRARLVCSR